MIPPSKISNMAPLHTYRKAPWNHLHEKVEKSEAIVEFAIGGARLDTSVMQLRKVLHSVSALLNKNKFSSWAKSLTTLNYINIYFRPGSFQSRSYFFTSVKVRACSPKQVRHRTCSICDALLSRSVLRSFASIQKPCKNNRSYMWTETLSGMIFMAEKSYPV